jgi:hypothetical protein
LKLVDLDEDPPQVRGDYHGKNQLIVAAAAWARGSTVVTSDRRLTTQLSNADIPTKLGFRLLNRSQAVSELCAGA